MLDESSLNLRCGKSMPRDVDDIVYTAPNPIVAFMISASAVTSELYYVSRKARTKLRADSRNSPGIH